MFVGGMSGFILDNTVPGATKEQRGLTKHVEVQSNSGETIDAYSFDPLVMKCLARVPLTRYMPFLPPISSSVASNSVSPVLESPFVTKL